jgi:hypothetical protein
MDPSQLPDGGLGRAPPTVSGLVGSRMYLMYVMFWCNCGLKILLGGGAPILTALLRGGLT